MSIEKLIEGYHRFRATRFEEARGVYHELERRGQSPKVLFIACCDSRVDPATITDAGPGELFVIRNVANLVPPYEREGHYHGTSAALEYAVDHLEVGHVVVLGHAHCGGIKSLFGTANADDAGNHFVAPWMSLVRSAHLRVEATMPDAPGEVKARACEQSAVLVSLENLMTFPGVRERVGDGRLRLHGWYFDIRACALCIYDADRQQFEPVD